MEHAHPFDGVSFDAVRVEHHTLLINDAKRLHHELLKLPASRERSLAITHLEETVMWAGKALKVWQLSDGE